MAPDGQTLAPNVYDAEPIPEAARVEIDRLLSSGDLFRYTAQKDAPVALLEAEFADLMGSRYALAVSSCSAALFISIKALDLPKGAKILIPDTHLDTGAQLERHHAQRVGALSRRRDELEVDRPDSLESIQRRRNGAAHHTMPRSCRTTA
jgi:cystathionine beta-lyase/cystathionine gamma-synthase